MYTVRGRGLIKGYSCRQGTSGVLDKCTLTQCDFSLFKFLDKLKILKWYPQNVFQRETLDFLYHKLNKQDFHGE